jgi:uncharacterized protein
MSVYKKTKELFYSALNKGSSPSKLALSFSIGIFIAFSPYPGAHTVIMLAVNWLLGLNLPMLFLATSVNNPWTLIPFYAADYSFGYWLVHSLFGFSPSWVVSLEKIFGSGSFCLWSFFIGGNVLGLAAGLISYPLMLKLFRFLASKKSGGVI